MSLNYNTEQNHYLMAEIFFFISVQTLKGKKYPSLKIQFLKYYFGPYDSG